MQIRLFTGKGGTGKTTIAAATGLKAAENNLKTLVISTDPAHSLSDALDTELGPEPVEISKNFYAQELNVYYSMKKYWDSLRKIILEMLKWQGMDKIQAEELSALPGMEEVSAFLWIEKYYREETFDFIVIDSAPTGETLTMLSLPQMTKWWSSKLFAMPKFAAKTFGSAINAAMGLPFSQSIDELDTLLEKLDFINTVMSDSSVTAARLVVNPEKMVIEEARRAYTYLELYGFNVDSVYVNKIIPNGEGGSFFKNYIESQEKYLNIIQKDFNPLKIFKINHSGTEVFGLELLKELGDLIYSDSNPEDIYSTDSPFEIKELKKGYMVEITLPFAEDKEVKAVKSGNYLVIDFEGRRRHIYLPRFLLFYDITEKNYNAPKLQIKFS
ncbi:MAG: ArsA family ATPase [Thermodesulfobacteriota bacterium]